MIQKLFGSLGVGHSCSVHLEFETTNGSPPPTVTLKNKKGIDETLPVYSNKDTLKGHVKVLPTPGKRVEHQGIKVQLVGEIELATERGYPHEFVSLVRDLAPPGEFVTQQHFPFEFANVEMQYESYRGIAARLRYLLRVTVTRGLGQSVVRDYAFLVRNEESVVHPSGPELKMEVGIEDCLHIEFEYNKGSYHLNDIVLGKIYFLLVRIKLKHMELEIRRRETTGAGTSARSDSETVAKYEIMDGGPVRGEIIPIRLYLAPYELTPSYENVHNKFSVKYFLNLVLVDDEDRRYFKQQEIKLYRLKEQGEEEKKESVAGGSGSSKKKERMPILASSSNVVRNVAGESPRPMNDVPPASAGRDVVGGSTAAAAVVKDGDGSSSISEMAVEEEGEANEENSGVVKEGGTPLDA